MGPQTVVGFTGLYQPYGVAVAGDGTVTATSYPDEGSSVAAVVRKPAGSQVTLDVGEIGSPFGVAVGADGATYVTDASAGTVLKVPAGGGAASTLGFTGLSFPTGVAVDAAGTVYVADSGNARVVKLPSASEQSTVPFTGLETPYGVAVDGDGTVYVADLDANEVVKRTAGGTQTTLGFTGLSSPDGVAVDDDGDVFVADANNDRVLELEATGGAQVVVPFTGLDAPAGVAVAGDGSVYVADSANNRVVALLDDTPANTADQSFVIAAYNDFIDRDPTPTELSTATTALAGGGSAKATFLKSLSTSNVYLAALVNGFYQDTLGRNGFAGEVAYWTGELRAGRRTVARVAADFYASKEYFDGFGESDNLTWVEDLYTKILLREADGAGAEYWAGVAEQKGRGYVSYPFFQSNESARTRVKILYG
ncbi:MAG TPA: DUF4214 domain-containing protein, partial [Iamia sp.]|nr:DUF4214 domain-containing protein [Iamia sp.]